MIEEIYLPDIGAWLRLYSEMFYQGGRGYVHTLYVRTHGGVLGRMLSEEEVLEARAEGRVRQARRSAEVAA